MTKIPFPIPKLLFVIVIAMIGGAVLFYVTTNEGGRSAGSVHGGLDQDGLAAVKGEAEKASGAVPLTPVKSGDIGLKPHKALYKIDLASTRSGSQIVNISGEMYYEWRASCEAWISDHRFDLLYEYADSAPMRITSDFSTYEAYDGDTLDYTSRRKRDGELFEELRGHAKIKETGVGEAVYTMPEGLVFDLPRGTVFPLGHSRLMLEHIRKGNKIFKAVIFDGSDEEGPVEVNSFIGKPVNAMAHVAGSTNLNMGLLNTPAWKVRLAFFPLKNDAAAADYEMDMVFHENGVMSDMLIEYDDFSITQTLVALEPLENECQEQGAAKLEPTGANGKRSKKAPEAASEDGAVNPPPDEADPPAQEPAD